MLGEERDRGFYSLSLEEGRQVGNGGLEGESRADDDVQVNIRGGLQGPKSCWSRVATLCGPALVFLSLGAVLGGLVARKSNLEAQATAERATRWSFDSKCDHLLSKDEDDREVVRDSCIDHANLKNFATAVPGSDILSFLVVGDWGRDGMCCQRDVAIEMGKTASHLNSSFIISVGDNFYPIGITKSDAEQVETSWLYVYNEDGIEALTWYSSLGNHDYYGNPEAVLGISKHQARWVLPSRYYSRRFTSEAGGVDIHAVFLDTTPLLSFYNQVDSVRKFWDQVATAEAYMDEQISFLRREFEGSDATWRIVIAHHPIFTSSEHYAEENTPLREKLQPVIQALNVTAYFNGHDHGLELHHPEGDQILYVLSGAGSQVRPGMYKEDEGFKFHASSNAGFVSVSASQELFQIQYIDFYGTLLHQVVATKS